MYRPGKIWLGSILLKQGCISEKQLNDVLDEQQKRQDALLGQILIQKGYCTYRDIDEAMAIQKEMCKYDKTKYAISIANTALKRQRRKSIVETKKRVVEKSKDCLKKITDNYPIITNKTAVK